MRAAGRKRHRQQRPFRVAASGFHRQASEAASATQEEHMGPLTVAASVVLVLVLAIFAIISILGLMKSPPNV